MAFIKKLLNWETLKRALWYAGAQALVVFLAELSGFIDQLEPTTWTVIVGLALSQITKAINSK